MLLPRELRQIISSAFAQFVERLEVVLRILNTCAETRRAAVRNSLRAEATAFAAASALEASSPPSAAKTKPAMEYVNV